MRLITLDELPWNTCTHLERLIKIKRWQLHNDLSTHDNVEKSRRFDEDLKAIT